MMQEHLGRELGTEEHVHHINGVRDDNRIENLQVVTPQEHRALHIAERPVRECEVVMPPADMSGSEAKEIRQKAGLSQQELADKLGVSVSLVFKWESGSRRVSSPVRKLLRDDGWMRI